MRRATPLALALALALLAAACTDNAEKPTAAAGPVGGTLTIGIARPGSVDPANAYEPAGRLVAELTCEPLLTLDPKTGDLEPGLATSWVVSNGGRRLTLRLRKARFANGDRVTADHVVRSLSRAASEEFAGNTATLLEPVAGFDVISGRAESRRERDRQRLRGLSVIDRSSLSIDLTRRDADFLRVLTHPVAAPTATDDERNPVCAGPYKLAAPWAPTQTAITLVRNEHYHGAHPVYSNGGRGYPDRIELRVDADPATVDVAAVDYDQFQRLGPQDRHERPSGHIDYVGVPLTQSDVVARSILQFSLDADTLLPGRPPAPGYLPGTECPHRSSGLTRSQQFPDALTLYFVDEFANRTIAETIASRWSNSLSMTVTPTPVTIDELVRKAASPQGVDGAFLMGWHPPVPRPDAYLAPLFTSAGIGTTNLSRYVDPDFDRILEREARGAVDEDDRRLGYRKAHDHLCETLPMIPVLQGMSRWKVDSGRVAAARGATLDAARGGPVLRELYLREGAS